MRCFVVVLGVWLVFGGLAYAQEMIPDYSALLPQLQAAVDGAPSGIEKQRLQHQLDSFKAGLARNAAISQ